MMLFLLMALTMSISSCSQDEEYYSCDKDVDQWVKSNIDDVQQMTRSQVLKFDDTVMKATYRAFKPEQRMAFWKEKLSEVKQLNWSSKELAHIYLVEQFIETHFQCFQGKVSDEDKDELEIFFHQWTKYAVDTLDWDRNTIVAIVVSGRRMLDTDGNLENSVDYKKISYEIIFQK